MSIVRGEETVHAAISGLGDELEDVEGWMLGSHPPSFFFFFGSLLCSRFSCLPLAGCWHHKCQACTERCNLSSRRRRPVEPTVRRRAEQIDRRAGAAAAEMLRV